MHDAHQLDHPIIGKRAAQNTAMSDVGSDLESGRHPGSAGQVLGLMVHVRQGQVRCGLPQGLKARSLNLLLGVDFGKSSAVVKEEPP